MTQKMKLRRHEEMAKYVIQTKRRAPPRGAYSQRWRAGISLLLAERVRLIQFMAGWSGTALSSRQSRPFDNIVAILKADGASLRDVVKVHVHLSDTSFVRAL